MPPIKRHTELFKFRVANKNLWNSLTILNVDRISYKRKLTIRNHVKELCKMNLIVCVMNYIDFAHISAIVLSGNDSVLKTHDSIQQKKFSKLL